MGSTLPQELIALVHNIELTEAHWWDKAIQRFLIYILWSEGAQTADQLRPAFASAFGITLDVGTIERHLDTLRSDGDVVPLPDQRMKLSEDTLDQVAHDLEVATGQQALLRERFALLLIEAGSQEDPNKAWQAFESQTLTPLVQELGARTYELLVANGAPGDAPSFQEVVTSMAALFDDATRRAIVTFLNPEDPDVRAYVLRALNAYFFAQASSLTSETLDAIQLSQKRQHDLRVFIDTNFLFSILKLHDNPTNEVAEALDSLIEKIRNRVRVRLFVLPITIDEAKGVLRAHIVNLAGFRPARNLAQAVALRPELPGLIKRYVEAAAESDQTLTPQDFFGPYESDLVPILRDRGVELFNEKMDNYRTRPDVVDDLLATQAFQQERRASVQKPMRRISTTWFSGTAFRRNDLTLRSLHSTLGTGSSQRTWVSLASIDGNARIRASRFASRQHH